MPDPVIRAEGLGKRYHIGLLRDTRRPALRETLAGIPARIRAARRAPGTPSPTELWAVRGLTLEVSPGEILGIVGPNGSGKSTLVRLAAGITDPTEGWIATHGRVATLLEVGTAFHPDLTGRENILLGGIVLGMRAAAVRRRFDEIVEFAGVGRFVDTPVKHYSSGMYLRLAFAVAAHLEADILLVDEVLAVGDLAFQDKCLTRIARVREEGRTAILVTHSLSALRQLCTRALLLDGGRVVAEGSADEVARRYEGASVHARRAAQPVVPLPGAAHDAGALGRELRFFDGAGMPGARFPAGTRWRARLEFQVSQPAEDVLAALTLRRVDGTTLVSLASERRALPRGHFHVEFACELPLAPGDVLIGAELWSGDRILYRAPDAALVEITMSGEEAPLPVGQGLLLTSRGAEIRPAAAAPLVRR